MKNQYDLISVSFNIEDKIMAQDFSDNFISCKRLDGLLENYNQKEVNVIGKRLLQELPQELHKELLEKNLGIMMASCEKFIDFSKIEVIPTSRYLVI